MKVFVAGASGALGSRLVPQLIDAGHDVIGTHNSPTRAELLRTLGVKPVMLDLLDASAVRKAVLEHEPEAIVHEATALANAKWGRNFDKVFANTNELRTKGTEALLAAARDAGVRRSVAQSFASYRYERAGGPVKTEDDPLDPNPPANARKSSAAMAYLEADYRLTARSGRAGNPLALARRPRRPPATLLLKARGGCARGSPARCRGSFV